MADNAVRSIAVVGGGVAGWLAAALLARVLRGACTVTVVDDEPAQGGMLEGEIATLPQLAGLHGILGIDENDLLRRTGGTFRLGGEFQDWGSIGERYFHPLGDTGATLDSIAFRHHWLRLHRLGAPERLEDFSLCAVAAKMGKFARPVSDRRSVLSTLAYGYHLDTALYARYLRDLALKSGASCLGAAIAGVEQREDGMVETLVLQDGTRVEADLFIDCTGSLIADSLKTGFENWSQWLPCDRVTVLSTDAGHDPLPYIGCIAHHAGWQWRIPLQHRTGNGYVYCSRYLEDEDAASALLSITAGDAVRELRSMSFTNGRRSKAWEKNVIAIGRAACTLEPLEGAPMHVIQVGLTRLLALFPDRSCATGEREEYNRLMASELERLRDFLILHYKATQRGDTAFWQYCREMELPELLAHKVRLFKSRGRVVLYDEETYPENSWASLSLGQGMLPERYDALADTLDVEQLRMQLKRMRAAIRAGADSMPPHGAFIARFCAAEPGRFA